MSIPASSDPVRLALIGAGRWGRIYLKTIAALPDVKLAGLVSRNHLAHTWVPPDCPIYSDWGEMIAAGNPDGVVVATPPASHAQIVAAALDAGLPVLVEKPLTMDLGEAEALLTQARRRHALVRVDHIHLYSPAFRELLRLAADVGPIRMVRGRAGNTAPFRSETPVLWDWGSHDVAMLLALAGRPTRGSAAVQERRDVEGGVGEVLRLDFSYPEFTAEIIVGTLMSKCRRFEVVGRDATLVYDDLASDKLTVDGRPIAVSSTPPLTVAVSEFAAAIRAGTRDLRDLELGVETVRLLSGLAAQLR